MYASSILIWFGLRVAFFHRFWWLALLNTLAFYLFLPLVVLLPLAFGRRWSWLIGLTAPSAIFAILFGPLLLQACKIT
jgi:hypothetical protein